MWYLIASIPDLCTLSYFVKYVHEVLVNRFALVRLAWFVFLASRNCCVALLQDAMGLSAVCDCGIS